MSNRNELGRAVAEAAAVRWCRLALAAPAGFAHPDLGPAVVRTITGHAARLPHGTRVALSVYWAEPLSLAIEDAAKERKWDLSGQGQGGPPRLAVVKVAVAQAMAADGVYFFHGPDGYPPEWEALLEACRRLGVRGRRVVVG